VHIVTNRNDIPDLLALADIFVMPSLFEGLPMALLEAMTAGKAIVASATSGIPEAIVDGRDGLLVTPGDVGSLSEALDKLIADPVRRRTLGASAAARALDEFTVQVMAERYETLYTDALSTSGRGAQNSA
jgi:glycosyltransferase involved in cell wall biosynthesis